MLATTRACAIGVHEAKHARGGGADAATVPRLAVATKPAPAPLGGRPEAAANSAAAAEAAACWTAAGWRARGGAPT